jgi:hypothetical protein
MAQMLSPYGFHCDRRLTLVRLSLRSTTVANARSSASLLSSAITLRAISMKRCDCAGSSNFGFGLCLWTLIMESHIRPIGCGQPLRAERKRTMPPCLPRVCLGSPTRGTYPRSCRSINRISDGLVGCSTTWFCPPRGCHSGPFLAARMRRDMNHAVFSPMPKVRWSSRMVMLPLRSTGWAPRPRRMRLWTRSTG